MYIFNSSTRRKEEFKPVHPGEVRIYTCGPTVYNYFHIGNARPFTTFDVHRRYFMYKGYKVTYVQNLTDIDDKMIDNSKKEGITVKEMGDHFIEEYFKDADALGIMRADVHPRATEHIPEIIEIIKKLEENGYAYQAADGVYFDTHKFKQYGHFSGQNIDELESGFRVSVDENKRNPADFALWKAYKEGEPFWESPWGKGRPGWHIECSAMSMKYLGETFDIHCGGQDLLFPHHENEVAQSCCATGKPFANYWMHNGFISINNEKMSKSKGNFFTVRDISAKYDLEVIRLFLLSAHYRSPINFSEDLVEQSKNGLERLYNAKADYEFALTNAADIELTEDQKAFIASLPDFEAKYCEAMDDDFNTANAIGVIFELVSAANIVVKPGLNKAVAKAALDMLLKLTDVLGLLKKDKTGADDEIMQLVEKRQQARKAKDWATADAVRDQLKAMGYVIEDTAQGPKVKKL
ncbi:MAG: cysteine--tRNA ligase [Clostridia bacterium]|nr:cysteine--tRNA ligase [Clostridia bacterium]